MVRIGRAACAVSAGVIAVMLTGCSVDQLIWGPEGAKVIAMTDDFVEAMTAGSEPAILCPDSAVDLGGPGDWSGLSAGEPERFVAAYWDEQAALDPQWNINLEGLPDGLSAGSDFPGDLFYRETDTGLCLVDVVWSTLDWQG